MRGTTRPARWSPPRPAPWSPGCPAGRSGSHWGSPPRRRWPIPSWRCWIASTRAETVPHRPRVPAADPLLQRAVGGPNARSVPRHPRGALVLLAGGLGAGRGSERALHVGGGGEVVREPEVRADHQVDLRGRAGVGVVAGAGHVERDVTGRARAVGVAAVPHLADPGDLAAAAVVADLVDDQPQLLQR